MSRRKASVLVLYTGGTLGMKPNADGALEPVDGYVESIMGRMEELKHESMPAWTFQPLPPIMDSSSMGPKDWLRIAAELERQYLDYDGFVVIMGADTVVYAASALSFLMQNLAKPVVFTGAMIPFASPWNDGRRNLIVALMFATCAELCEVCIAFGGRLLRANRTCKVSNVDVRAFDSPNLPPLGELSASRFGAHGEVQLNKYLLLPRPRGRLKVHKDVQSNILVIKTNPGAQLKDVRIVVECATELQALVLEMYGVGNHRMKAPLLELMRTAMARGTIVVVSSQCTQGRVVPEEGGVVAELLAAGALSAHDMTTEAVVTKLGVLLAIGHSLEEVKDLMGVAICGEVTERDHPPSKL